MVFRSVNPATGDLIETYEEMPWTDVEKTLEHARDAQREWRRTGFPERTARMTALARLLRDDKEMYARLMAVEMGKPVTVGRFEVEKCAAACDYYARFAESLLKPEPVITEAQKCYVAYQPLGVILGIMPWNWPFWQVFRGAVPALMAGNGFLLKHADNVPGCALAIEKLFFEAGFPDALFCSLLVPVSSVKSLIESNVVVAVTLTGSTRAGREVARIAGAALKKTVLELGGSNPFIILEDADVPRVADIGFGSRMSNNGQSCLSAKRFVVVESRREEFESLLLQKMKAVRMGDPLLDETDLGPLARPDLRDALHRQVVESVEKGARLLLGGTIPPGPGAFYPPTVLTGVAKGMPAYEEELFGPAAAVIGVRDEAEAIRVANDNKFGLGAAVFTADARRGEAIARDEIEAGSGFVNDAPRSDPRFPFGGIKESGYGRELGPHGIRELVNVKTIYVR